MSQLVPEISKQISNEDIREIIEKNFVSIMPVWAPLQLAWVNNVYRTFHDAIPARTTIPNVVNLKKANTELIINAENAKYISLQYG